MIIVTIALLAFLVQAPPQTGAGSSPATVVRGVVVDTDGHPLDGAVVSGRPLGSVAVTGPDGAFELTTEKGHPAPATIMVTLPGYRSASITTASATMPILIVLSKSLLTFRSTTTASSASVDPSSASRIALKPLDVVRTAGTQSDLMRELATLPGVNTIDGGAGLFVRGGDVSEVQVLFDGVVVNHPYRNETPTGGFRGAVDPFMTRDITFTTGGFAAPYGDALSAVVDLAPLDRPTATQMTMTAGLAGVSFSDAQPVGSHSGFRIAANRSTPSVLFAINSSAEPFDQYPGGWDLSGAWYWTSPALGSLRVFGLRQADHVGVQIQRDTFTGFLHSSTSHSLLTAHWEKSRSQAWRASASIGTDRYDSAESAGVLQLSKADANHSARVDLTATTGPWTVHGGETMDLDRPHDVGQVPFVGGDFAGTGGTKHFAVSDRSWTTGIFVDLTRTLGRLIPEVGFRTDYFSNAHAWSADPRAAAVLVLTKNQRIRLALGQYHEAPAAAYFDSVAGNPRLPPMQARHAILGYEVGNANGPSFLRIEAYDKWYADLPLQTEKGFDATGYGHAHGVDFFLTHTWRLVTMRTNASWLDAARRWTPFTQQNTYPLPPSGTWPPDFDIPYAFEIVSTVKAPRGFLIETAWRTTAGTPSTPAQGAVLTPRGYQPMWGAINAERLPAYERFDLSISHNALVATRPAIVFLSLGNVLDHRNVSSYVYSADYQTRTTVPSGSPRSVYVGFTIR